MPLLAASAPQTDVLNPHLKWIDAIIYVHATAGSILIALQDLVIVKCELL